MDFEIQNPKCSTHLSQTNKLLLPSLNETGEATVTAYAARFFAKAAPKVALQTVHTLLLINAAAVMPPKKSGLQK